MRCSILAAILLLAGLSSCSSSAKDKIINRWKATGSYGDEKEKERYRKRFAEHTTEFEFASDGKFFAYSGGELQGTATHTMAPDGKSLVVNADGEQLSMRIVNLSSGKLEAVTRGFMSSRDTIIYEAVK